MINVLSGWIRAIYSTTYNLPGRLPSVRVSEREGGKDRSGTGSEEKKMMEGKIKKKKTKGNAGGKVKWDLGEKKG